MEQDEQSESTPNQNTHQDHHWLQAIKARGMDDAFLTLLDVLEPVGPLGAQLLWLSQPVFGVVGWHKAIGALAEALEAPDGVENLRRHLHNDET